MEFKETPDKYYAAWLLLHQTHLLLLKAREKELKKYKITFEESLTLGVIQRMGGNPTVSDISRLSIRGYHTIAAMVNRMARRGLLKREKRNGKESPGGVTITEKGHEAWLLASKREAVNAAISTLSEEERVQFMNLLKRVRDGAILYTAFQDTLQI